MRVEKRHFRCAGSQIIYLPSVLSQEVIGGCAWQNEGISKTKKKNKRKREKTQKTELLAAERGTEIFRITVKIILN